MSATIISAPQAHSAFVDRELHAGNGYVMLGIGLALIVVSCWLAYTGFVVGRSLVPALGRSRSDHLRHRCAKGARRASA
jgi:hypothetical protein